MGARRGGMGRGPVLRARNEAPVVSCEDMGAPLRPESLCVIGTKYKALYINSYSEEVWCACHNHITFQGVNNLD